MRQIITFFLSMCLLSLSHPSNAQLICDKKNKNYQEQNILLCYVQETEKIATPWSLEQKYQDQDYQVTISRYTLNSQYWPKSDARIEAKLWQHNFLIYQPKEIKTQQALLFVNGGTRYQTEHSNPPPQAINFARIAAETNSVVIDLQDVPNQYLMFDDNVQRKEDSIIAYTWNRYMDDPEHNAYWPLHLAMTKAVIKAMDAAQKIVKQESGVQLTHFVISGASKRGWTTWLTALADNRVNAIIPIVIDILNTKENLDHIYSSYQNAWPPAFYDYIKEKVTDRFHSAAFDQLMNIEDPIRYLQCNDYNYFKTRLSIPKYIISASGDDFFVPDSLNFYFDKLPGENIIRVIPNQSHFIDVNLVENAVLTYYKKIVKQTQRPILRWSLAKDGSISAIDTNQKPISVTLWQASNPDKHDFRKAANIGYVATPLKGTCRKTNCHYPVLVEIPNKGWKASFVEVTYQKNITSEYCQTTPIFVTPS